jgi:hypothetical protein
MGAGAFMAAPPYSAIAMKRELAPAAAVIARPIRMPAARVRSRPSPVLSRPALTAIAALAIASNSSPGSRA